MIFKIGDTVHIKTYNLKGFVVYSSTGFYMDSSNSYLISFEKPHTLRGIRDGEFCQTHEMSRNKILMIEKEYKMHKHKKEYCD